MLQKARRRCQGFQGFQDVQGLVGDDQLRWDDLLDRTQIGQGERQAPGQRPLAQPLGVLALGGDQRASMGAAEPLPQFWTPQTQRSARSGSATALPTPRSSSPRPGRAVVIETAARPGSSHIGVLHEALGLHPWRMCLDIACGRPANLTPTRHGFAVDAGLPPVGPGVPEDHLRRQVGDLVQAPGNNSSRRRRRPRRPAPGRHPRRRALWSRQRAGRQRVVSSASRAAMVS